MDEHKLQRVLERFPWRRRKPRVGALGIPPIALRTRDGEQVWADPQELATFADPGPALLCVALHGDSTGRALVWSLVEHHARTRGIELPRKVSDATKAGVVLLDQLIDQSGLDRAAAVGPHAIGELVTATWALAAGEHEQPAAAGPS